MQRCPSCFRHAKSAEQSCPFCRTALRSVPAPLRGLAPVLLGVAFAGCVEKGDDSDGGSSSAEGTDESDSSGGTGSGETGTGGMESSSETAETDTGMSATDTMESSGAEYGGFEDTTEDTGGQKLDVGAGTVTDTATDTTESGGSDYGGPPDDPSDTRNKPQAPPRPR